LNEGAAGGRKLDRYADGLILGAVAAGVNNERLVRVIRAGFGKSLQAR
jgi:hypothetical protein